MMRFAQTTLIPNMAEALSAHLDGFSLVREIIRVYVDTVAAEPEIYPFVMANSSASKSKVIADSERIIRDADGDAAPAHARGRDGHPRRGDLVLHDRRRCAVGDPLVDVAPADELRRTDRLPAHAVVERVGRHRRG